MSSKPLYKRVLLKASGEAAKAGEPSTEATTPAPATTAAAAPVEEKPNEATKQIWFWVLLVVIAAILAWMLVSNRKKTPRKKTA